MPTKLRAARKDRGWTQQRVLNELDRAARARSIALPSAVSMKAMLSRWENGHQTPDEFYRDLLREVLELDDQELGFAPPDDFGRLTTAQTLAAAMDRSRSLDPESLAAVARQVDDIRMLDRRVGGHSLVEQTRNHVRTIEEWLSYSTSITMRRLLAKTLADAASLAGWQALDLGATSQAWQHFETAKNAAREAGDPSLLAWSTGEQAYVLLDLNQPQDAENLVGSTREELSSSLPMVVGCWLAAAHAEAHAANGDEARSREALDQADHMLTSNADTTETPYVSLDATHLARWRGNVLAKLGDPQAINDLEFAATSAGGSSARAEASLHVDLAISYKQLGDIGASKTYATSAASLARRVGSVRQQRRLMILAS